jgi:hypothetical protein
MRRSRLGSPNEFPPEEVDDARLWGIARGIADHSLQDKRVINRMGFSNGRTPSPPALFARL